MKTLAETHVGLPPTPADAAGDPPPSRVGRRLLDLADQAIRFPSDTFAGRDCITKGEWEHRHARTYGERGHGAELTVFVLLLTALLALGLFAYLSGSFDHVLGDLL